MPQISLIAACGTRTRAIGKDGRLLWHVPGDLPRFKALTMGHPIIMGRTTFTSIGTPLPGRTNIVLSHERENEQPGVTYCTTIDAALDYARSVDDHELFVIGGGSVYAQTIAIADRLHLTLVDDDAPGDTFFPDYTMLPFREIEHEEHTAAGLTFAYVTYERTSRQIQD